MNDFLLKQRECFFSSQHAMFWPAGPVWAGPEGGNEEKCGKMKKAAPVSIS
jgi:hypothetical protein